MKADLKLREDPWTAELYDLHLQSAGGVDDMGLWLALAEETGGPVLELGSGTGRVLLHLAQAGFEVAGLEISPHMLAVARRKLAQERPEVRARVRLVQGDMSDFSLGERYGAIIIPARAFQQVVERSDQRGCLEACASHLRTDGRLAIDLFNPRLARLAQPGGVGEAPAEYSGPEGETVRETGHSDYDVANQRLVWHVRYECIGRDGKTTMREYALPLRYFFRFEVEWMLEACGFEVEALYGDFDRSLFSAESPEMIFVARKAG